MPIWTAGAEVLVHNSLATFIAEQAYFESANANAVASLSLTGSPRIYTETVAIAVASAVSATEIGVELGEVTNPISVAVGTGITGGVGQGAVIPRLPLVNSGEFKVGEVTTLLPVVSGTTSSPTFSIAYVAPPPPVVIAQLESGQFILGEVQVPLAQVNATSGFVASVQPNIPVVNAAGLTGNVGIGAVNNVLTQVAGVSSQEALTIGAAVAINPVVLGEMLQETLSVGSAQPRLSTISATGLSGGISTGGISLPMVEVDGTLIPTAFITGEVLAPLPYVLGTGLGTVSTFVTWALNTENNRVTNYTQFPFTALGLFGTNPVGATADGLYLLTGDNDDGQSIDAAFAFGMTDFRNELINNADVYVGGDMAGDMEVTIREDGQDDGSIYTLSERERHARGHHAKLGKGFRSRYREISISNVNGGNFDLDSLSLSSRDLRGNE